MSQEAGAYAAEAMLNAGNISGAERMARAILDRDPQSWEGAMLLAMIADKRGEHEKALVLQDRVLALDPRDPHARTLRFHTLLRLRRLEDAREVLDALERDYPDLQGLRLLRLALRMAPADVAATKEEVARLREERGDCYEVAIAESAVAYGEDRYTDAYRHAVAALAYDPQDATAHDLAASAAFWSFRPRRARHHAQEALRSDPAAAGMRGVSRMVRGLWFPPTGLVYSCWVGQGFLAGKIGVLPAILSVFLFCKFVLGPVLAAFVAVAPPGVLPIVTVCLVGSLAWFAIETFVITKREKTRAAQTVSLAGY